MSSRRTAVIGILFVIFLTLCGIIALELIKDNRLSKNADHGAEEQTAEETNQPEEADQSEEESNFVIDNTVNGPAMVLSGEAAADSGSYTSNQDVQYEESQAGPYLVIGDAYLSMLEHSSVITQGIIDGLEFSVADRTFEEKADDGTVILSASYYEPSIRIDEYKASEQAISSALTQNVDNIKTEIELLSSEAGAFYTGREGDSYEPTTVNSILSEGRLDMTCISLVEKTSIRTSQSELNTDLTGYTFDTKTGNVLTLESIAEDSNELKNCIVSQMQSICNTNTDIDFFDLYEEVLPAVLREGNWYLTTKGLVIIVPDSMIAPHSAGMLSFVIPYKDLKGLKGEYSL